MTRHLLLALGALCAGIVVAGVAHRALVHGATRFYVDENVVRQETLMRALPTVLRDPHPIGIIIGASTLVRLDPLLLDRHLHDAGTELVTYNLALNGVGPEPASLLVRRVKEAMPSPPRRVTLAILDVSLTLLTEKHSVDPEPFFYIGLEDWRGLASMVRTRPAMAFDVAFRKYILDDEYYGDVASFWIERVLNRAWHCRVQPDPGSTPEQARAIADYCALERVTLHGEYDNDWHLAARGYDAFAPPALLPQFEAAQGFDMVPSDDALEAMFARHIDKLARRYDLLELHFDEQVVMQLLDVARSLLTFTDHVVFMLSPENPLVQRSSAAEARMQALIAQLKTVSPDVVDLRHAPHLVLADFRDAIHVTFGRDASNRFAADVAQAVAPILGSVTR